MFASLKAMFQEWWKDHGTKIIGFGTALIGTISAIDQATVQLIEREFGSMYAHAILIIAGLSTAWRGFTNSQKNQTNGPVG